MSEIYSNIVRSEGNQREETRFSQLIKKINQKNYIFGSLCKTSEL